MTEQTRYIQKGKELTEIPSISSSETKNIVYCELTNNLLTNINSICSMKNVTTLRVNKNKLSSFPKKIHNLTKLKILEMNSNVIEKIPKEIGKLTALQDLSLVKNKIKEIPSSFSKVINLQRCYLSANYIILLPFLPQFH